MIIVHDLEKFKAPWQKCVLTLGVFDGFHKGHQGLLNAILHPSYGKEYARVLVTYHPHPDFVLNKRKKPIEIFHFDEKLALLQKYPLDAVIFLKFSVEFSQIEATDYLKNFLIKKLKAKEIIIGYDQCFGYQRKGNYSFLKKHVQDYDYNVKRIRPVRFLGKKVSSSRIRQSLHEGRIKQANRLLGHEFSMKGLVVVGFQRGKELGFPTINLSLHKTKIIPAQGVYTGYMDWGNKRYKVMINIGKNPTFQNTQTSIEAHILNFSETIYGEQVCIYFVDRIRKEKKFSDPEQLRKQLLEDKKLVENRDFHH